MSHYYQNDPTLSSVDKTIKYTFRGKEISYNVDLGVFSKDRVDFGTNTLINNLPVFEDGMHILDMGCGYGIIGLAIAKAYPKCHIDMVDVNRRAVSLVEKNILLNKITNAKVYEGNLYTYIKDNNISYKYDYIISNPPIRAGKAIVHGIVSNGYDELIDGGSIMVVIQKKQGAPSMREKMKEIYKNVEIIDKVNGYFVFKSNK